MIFFSYIHKSNCLELLIMETVSYEYIELQDLLGRLREGVEELFPSKVWVKAEIASVSVKSNGHCYLELCQSDGTALVSKVKAMIWRGRYSQIAHYFESETGSGFEPGMTILVRAQVTFSELYGTSLVVDEVEPLLTLGEAEARRRKTIERLLSEGLMGLQKELALPRLPYRLAVISAADAAGYGDFRRHLLENEYGFAFDVRLFEAAMQGAGAPSSIVGAIREVEAAEDAFDAVLILRGGGSALDLACFDEYEMCAAIARCTLPVYTAVGHDRDSHVADMVANVAVKTPTALADEFISAVAAEDEQVSAFATRLRLAFNAKISGMESRVELLKSRIHAADPRSILSRGYVLVTDSKGVPVKSAEKLSCGEEAAIMFSDGTVKVRVQ